MKILLLGTDNFTASALYFMVSNRYNVCAVITHKNAKHYSRLQSIAKKLNIPFYIVNNINSEESYQLISSINPDIIFSIHFDRILSEEIYKLAKICAINLHPSLLPKYRGMSPFQSVILNGETETGITIHHIKKEVDDGNIIVQKQIKISKDINLTELQIIMMNNYPDVIREALEKIKANDYDGYTQDKYLSTYYGKVKKEDYIIHYDDGIEKAYNKVRAYTKPDNGAKFMDYTLWYALKVYEISDKKNMYEETSDGLKIYFDKGYLYIKKGNYNISIMKNDDNLDGGGIFIMDNFIELIKYKNQNSYGKVSFNYTNLYSEPSCFNQLISLLIKYDDYMVFLQTYEEFYKLYYISETEDNMIHAINNATNIIKEKPIIIEYLYKRNQANSLDSIVNNTCFTYYGGILRLQKKITIEDIGNKNTHISKAVTDNIDEIMGIHSNIFNKYIDRHIEYSELYNLINNGNVLIYVDEKRILGCLIYTIRGKYYHLRYWFVDTKKSQHKQGIGKALIKELYNIAGVGKFIEVWSRKDNTIVTEIYEKYGFKKDGLESDIFIYANNSSTIESLNPLN